MNMKNIHWNMLITHNVLDAVGMMTRKGELQFYMPTNTYVTLLLVNNGEVMQPLPLSKKYYTQKIHQ